MASRTYSPEAKAEALRIYEKEGPSEAARQTGIAKQTITGWGKAAGVRTYGTYLTRKATEAREAGFARRAVDLRHRLLAEAFDALDQIHETQVQFVGKDGDRVELDRAPASDTRNFMLTATNAIDKMRLLGGESTAKTEHVNQTEFDAEVKALTEKLKA